MGQYLARLDADDVAFRVGPGSVDVYAKEHYSRSVDKHGSFHLRAGPWVNGLFRSNTKRSTLLRSPALQDNSFTRRR
jgi:hypothetical protein